MSTTTYLSCAETAKLLRVALKKAFPGVKFSVRSDTYSGGASIHVSWTDGPRASEVDKIAGQFNGADFDGSIDLKSYNSHWLEADGSVSIAHAQGTQGSMGYQPEVFGDPQGPTATEVHFGADFVFTHRDVSEEWQAEILAEFTRVTGIEFDMTDKWGVWRTQVPLAVERFGDDAGKLHHMVETETQDLSSVFHQYVASRDR